jgi:hypothetical protein
MHSRFAKSDERLRTVRRATCHIVDPGKFNRGDGKGTRRTFRTFRMHGEAEREARIRLEESMCRALVIRAAENGETIHDIALRAIAAELK